MKASDILVKALENEGVEYIFGVPGEENLDFVESLRTSKIQLIVTRHEQAAGFMAATIGRLTGKPGVCLSTLGPGATNLVTAAAYATLGGMPMVMITGQKPIKSSKQGRFQIVDVVEMMKPITKYAKSIIDAKLIASHVREAFRISMEERPGAVHLELPEDIADEQVDDAFIFPNEKNRRAVAEEKAIARAVAMIKDAQMPLLLIGAGANRKMTARMLREFVDSTGIPFFTTQMGKGVIDERHPQYLGCAALSQNDYLHCVIDQADLVINVGHDVIEKPPFLVVRGKTKVIHVNFLSASVDNVYYPELEVVGDIGNAVWQMKEKLSAEKYVFPTNNKTAYLQRMKTKLAEKLVVGADDGRFPLLPQRVVADIRSVLRDEDIVTLDNGMYKLWFAKNYLAHAPNTLLLDNALATMGAGLPSAMAAKLLYPDKHVVAVCGDGGFMMNSQELETAVRMGLHLTIVILNDNGYGMIKWKQEGMGFENYGLEFGNPDFVKYARAYGATGVRVQSADEFKTVLETACQHKGVTLIEVPVDYSLNNEMLNRELKDKSCEL